MKVLGILAGIFVVMVIGVFVVGPAVVEHFAFKKLSPEDAASYGPWKNKKLTIPAEAVKVAPFSPATESAAKAFREAWKKYEIRAREVEEKHYPQGKDISIKNLDIAAVKRDITELIPLLQAFETLVNQPDYEINAQVAGLVSGDGEPNIGGIPFPNFRGVETCAKLLTLKSFVQADAGQSAQALNTAATIVHSARSTPYDKLVSQLNGVAVCTVGVRTWGEVVVPCKDPQLLRKALERQHELMREQVFLDNSVPFPILDDLGAIREINRRGMNFNIQGLTARQITAERWAAEAEYGQRIILPEFRNDPKMTEFVNDNIKQAQQMASFYGYRYSRASIKTWFVLSYIGPTFYALVLFPNYLGVHTRAELARTQFDLLRLNTARQIWTLEHGAPPARMADLVPSLLPEVPVDRFAKGKEKNDKSEKQTYGEGTVWYSIGPDGLDQKGALVYDPTNGTISPGDVVLAR